MATFRLAFKSFLKTKYISIATLLLLIGAIAFQLLAQGSSVSIDGLFYVFQFSLIYLVVFMLLSYEFFSKMRRNNSEEFIQSLGGRAKFLFAQFAVMCCVAAVFFLSMFALTTLDFLIAGIGHPEYIAYIFLCLLLNLFLLCVVGIVIGMAASLYLKRVGAYVLILAFCFMCSSYASSIFESINLYSVFDLFNITVPDVFQTPNWSFGYSLLSYRWWRVAFWLFFALGLALVKLYRTEGRKRALSAVISVALCAVSLVGLFLPASRVDMSDHYQIAEMNYYEANAAKESEPDFRVTQYDMALQVGRELRAQATMTLSDKALSEYRFTLYHGYRVRSVTDGSGNELDYTRDADYLTVRRGSQELDKITVTYAGSSMTFYSNRQGTFLSGAFCYYPREGFYYADSPYLSQDDAAYNVSIRGGRKFYSNLTEQADGSFTGNARGAAFLSGFLDSATVNSTEIIYPFAAANEISPIEEMRFMTNSKLWDRSITTVAMTPSLLRGVLPEEYGGFMETRTSAGLQESYERPLINGDKQELYSIFTALLRGQNYMLNSHVEAEKYDGTPGVYTALDELIKNSGKEKVLAALEEYIYDNEDVRSPEEFTEELKNAWSDTDA